MKCYRLGKKDGTSGKRVGSNNFVGGEVNTTARKGGGSFIARTGWGGGVLGVVRKWEGGNLTKQIARGEDTSVGCPTFLVKTRAGLLGGAETRP